MSKPTPKKQSAQTTGHAWDGDIQEYNNPVPTWWIWAFYATVVFALVYWLLYPAWPVGKSYTTGMMNDITFVNDKGEKVTTHWNTRSLYLSKQQTDPKAVRQKEYFQEVANTSYEDILKDPDKMAFMRSTSKVLFADNCAGCHGSGGSGVVGFYPNLADDDWLWGGSIHDIQQSIELGRYGYMPKFEKTFSAHELDAVAQYVLSLSGIEGGDAAAITAGQGLFQGQGGGCYYCHSADATGLKSQGAANLTDKIWTIVDVSAEHEYQGKLSLVKNVIRNGVERKMPAWNGRLTDEQNKMLTVFIHQLGGGQ